MNNPAFVLPMALMVTALGAIGQTLMKKAINLIPVGAPWPEAVAVVARSGWLWLGAVITGLGTISWFVVLSRADLSYATPLAGIGIVLVMISSAVILGEPIGAWRIAGTLVIAAGVWLVMRGG
jgi:drug/metabolite transporter (DMT)-like permease